jgi:hypothetical protein
VGMRYFLILTVFMVLPAQAFEGLVMKGALMNEARRSAGFTYSAFDFMFALGYERPLSQEWGLVGAGRVTLIQEELLTAVPPSGEVHARLGVGGEVAKLFWLSKEADLRLGLVADLHFGIPNALVALYTGLLLGSRYHYGPKYFVGIYSEIGTWPAFDGIRPSSRIGLEVGVEL